eukprot:sb/3468093/
MGRGSNSGGFAYNRKYMKLFDMTHYSCNSSSYQLHSCPALSRDSTVFMCNDLVVFVRPNNGGQCEEAWRAASLDTISVLLQGADYEQYYLSVPIFPFLYFNSEEGYQLQCTFLHVGNGSQIIWTDWKGSQVTDDTSNLPTPDNRGMVTVLKLAMGQGNVYTCTVEHNDKRDYAVINLLTSNPDVTLTRSLEDPVMAGSEFSCDAVAVSTCSLSWSNIDPPQVTETDFSADGQKTNTLHIEKGWLKENITFKMTAENEEQNQVVKPLHIHVIG